MGPVALLLSAAWAGSHVGTVDSDTVVWESTFNPGQSDCVRLLRAFDAPVENGVLRTLDGQPHLCTNRPGRPFTVVTRQAFPSDAITLPLAAEGLQRVVLGGARFEPDPELGLEKGLNFWGTPGVSQKERRRMNRALDGMLRIPRGTRVYLRPNERLARRGLSGTLRESSASLWTMLVAGGLFVAVLFLFALAYRWLERGARRERVAAWMAENPELSEIP